MKERPILFNGPMVRALLDGSKTQTRRVMKTYPAVLGDCFEGRRKGNGYGRDYLLGIPFHRVDVLEVCPHGQPGDQLWVRETTINVEEHGYVGPVFVESDEGRATLDGGLGSPDDFAEVEPHQLKKRPSIFMPRSMSRIALEIVNVRVERLQDISRGDAMAEGCPFPNMAQGDDPRKWYADLWNSINGPGSWDANPWVWVVEFKVVKP